MRQTHFIPEADLGRSKTSAEVRLLVAERERGAVVERSREGLREGRPVFALYRSLENGSMSTEVSTTQRATIVADKDRLKFLPDLFGTSHLILAENIVYFFMEKLSPLDYSGGFWDFYEFDGKPLFLAPQSKARFRITGGVTCFQGEVSAEAAGIIATLFTFSHLSFQAESERFSEGYGRLYHYAGDHPEASEIFQAID